MKPKVIVITGATHGLGEAAARRLVGRGHRVVIVGRSESKVAELARELHTECFVADFRRLREVRSLADRLRCYSRIDVLANNADAPLTLEHGVTEDGHNVTFQAGYLAGFLLTTRLIDRLAKSRATVICASNAWHRFGSLDLEHLAAGRHHSALRAYCDSRLAQILFARELHRRYGCRGVAAAAFESSSRGASTLVALAEGRAELDFACGQYYDARAIARASRRAHDDMHAFELWNCTEAMLDRAPSSRMVTVPEGLAV